MEPTTYTYSKFYGWVGLIFLSFAVVMLLFMGIASHDMKLLIAATVCAIAFGCLLYYAIRWVFIPAINDCIALEMDEDKVYCYITDQTIYWKDVVEISEDFSRSSSFIKFDMIDDSTIKIPTKWITGRNKDIYDKMQEYFARTL